MRIAFVGAGNLSTRLSMSLQGAGHEAVAVYSRTESSARQLAGKLGCAFTTRLEDMPEADICLFSVADDALPALVQRMERVSPSAIFLHTAGSVPLSVFEGHGAGYGVAYPMQTFSKERTVDFRRVPVFVEGSDKETLRLLSDLFSGISSNVMELDSERRKYLHLAAVFACNFTNHCYAMASGLLAKCGLPFELLLPLIDETADKVHSMDAGAAQTGPAARNDRKVMEMHEALLADDGEALSLYRLMSRSIYERNKKKGG